jgi:hypothetical protein
MARRLGTPIAVRRLRKPGSRRAVLVRLGKPRRSGRDWLAPFQIRGLDSDEIQYGYGVDAVQAVISMLEGVRVTLDGSGERLTWVGGLPAATGFPRYVPDCGSSRLRKRIEQLIDREVRSFVRGLERRHRARRHCGKLEAPRASAAHLIAFGRLGPPYR